jgi:hypothetical protein
MGRARTKPKAPDVTDQLLRVRVELANAKAALAARDDKVNRDWLEFVRAWLNYLLDEASRRDNT